ncbi:hypothetical protein PoB_005181700 [Plakobranchus ocellatus]|uniref:Uncharacterized protein n=1 Tax=Plakobranchus ocellatus TaxID=259542 RepID=A0AAV4C1T8_9GAST|nr:hypothetical protein PoB_005181700 [Plakobranchus ocellatus]
MLQVIVCFSADWNGCRRGVALLVLMPSTNHNGFHDVVPKVSETDKLWMFYIKKDFSHWSRLYVPKSMVHRKIPWKEDLPSGTHGVVALSSPEGFDMPPNGFIGFLQYYIRSTERSHGRKTFLVAPMV